MDINMTFNGVAVAGMPASFRAASAVSAAHRPAGVAVVGSAHLVPQAPPVPAAGAGWPAAAAVITPQRKRRSATANRASVDRSHY